ncbi:Very-long-chain enoyl-CoA reductase [Cytospora mali]|uniref:Very-long-chain enoyl-CoA reductase n=2 Tax=Cytospora mali TaxID=578113 RepID=A0ACD6AYJ1_CYTMA|nr:Very-long-chain enoyl-CoA reductase [Valsa mali var. pyri (nom. inval.)]KUI73918.1 Very-long-chain enoyl-CoA reductase [Valsa mali]
MASQISLKLSNRAPKKPLRKLPPSIEVPKDAEIDDVKKAVARQVGFKDHNRVGLFYPSTKKRIADRRALVRDQEDVTSNGEILVQDLGPQMAWRTVFLVEYLGPILFHALFYTIRPQLAKIDPYFYKDADKIPVTIVQTICFYMFTAHFVKRELETAFLHKFSASTMPAFNIFRNSFFYWFFAGLLSAYFIYSPRSLSARTELGLLDYVGIALFLVGETCNFIVHKHLAGLRKPGGTEKGIPSCIGSSLVTSPNYMFEVTAWIGVILFSREWAVVVFICVGTSYMAQWSRDKERALRATFGDKYKNKRYTMLPGLI